MSTLPAVTSAERRYADDSSNRGGAGGLLTITAGCGGAAGDPRDRAPQLRAYLSSPMWWDAREWKMVGYRHSGDEDWRQVHTPLSRALDAFRKAHPQFKTIREAVEGVRGWPVEEMAKFGPILYAVRERAPDVTFGMEPHEIDALIEREEAAYRRRMEAKRAKEARNEQKSALHAYLSRPWIPSERRKGRRLEAEDLYDGSREDVLLWGYAYTEEDGGLVVRPA